LRKKTPAEVEKAKIAKATRTLIRLKHSLAADEELNAVLPDTLEEFDEALARGELRELKAGLKDVLGGDDAAGA
jgi:arginine/lysine/ornithine decarboxylase